MGFSSTYSGLAAHKHSSVSGDGGELDGDVTETDGVNLITYIMVHG